LDVDINKLIQEVYVSPSSPDWVKPLIEDIVKKYKLNKSVKKSDLNSKGLW